MVRCRLCNRRFKMLTNSHLKTHDHTPESYLNAFPGEVLCDDVMMRRYARTRKRVKRKVCARPGCRERVTVNPNKYCSRSCAMSHRMSLEGRNEQSGERNKQFAGGWYSLGRRRKTEAKERDGYTCRRCGVTGNGKKMHAHHVIPERCFDTPQEAHRLDNLISLCSSCHKTVEWEMVRELYRRAVQLDQIFADNADHETMEALISRLSGSGGSL